MATRSAKKQLYTILLIVFLGFLGISMPYLIFPALFLNPEYSIVPASWGPSSPALLLGITLAAYPLGQFLGSPILGSLSDDYGRKPLLWGSLLIACLCYLLTGLALEWHMLWLVIVSRLIAGFMEGNIAIARAMAADIKTISKHETFGKINAVASIAFLLGPLLGGVLADNQFFTSFTVSTPFYLVSVLFLGLGLLSLVLLQKQTAPQKKEDKTIFSRLNLIKRLALLFKNKQLRFLLLVSTFFTLAVDIFYQFNPVYLTTKWMLSPVQLVLYNSVLCFALAVGNGWFTTFFAKRYPSRQGIIGALGGMALFLIGTILVNQSILMLAIFALCGLAIGLGVTLLTVKISDSVSDHVQGEVMGVQQSLRVLGDGLICLIGGVLLLFSAKLILVIAAFISAASALYYAKRRH